MITKSLINKSRTLKEKATRLSGFYIISIFDFETILVQLLCYT